MWWQSEQCPHFPVLYADVWQGSSSPLTSTYFDWFKWQCKPKPSVYLYWLWRDRQSKVGGTDGVLITLSWKFIIPVASGASIWHSGTLRSDPFFFLFFPPRTLSPFSNTLYILSNWTHQNSLPTPTLFSFANPDTSNTLSSYPIFKPVHP